MGGVEGDTSKQEVLSGDWTVPGLARLGNGVVGGDLEPLTGVATASAAGPAVTAAAVVSSFGNSLAAKLGPQTLKVSRQLFRSKITRALSWKVAPTNPPTTVWMLALIWPKLLILWPPKENL